MNDTEKLIEEAFKKHDAPTWGDDEIARDAAIRWHMRGFNDALAVFEKAHTPTDDEREVPQPDLCDRCGWAISAHSRSMYGLDCPMSSRPGFRRSEEPSEQAWSTEDRREALAEGLRRWSVQGQHDRVEQRDHDLYGMGARQGFSLGAEWWKSTHAATEPQGEPSDARVLDDAEAMSDLLDEMNEAGVMPELPFRDAQDIAGVAYLVDEGDTTRAVFLSDPGEDRVQYDGHSEDDASYVGLFERPIDELHGPIAVLPAAGGAR